MSAPVEEPVVPAPATEPPQAAAEPPAKPEPSNGRDEAMARERRAREKAEDEAKKAKDALAERERKEAEERGEFEKLAREQQERADRLEAEKRAEQARMHAERSASDKKFKDTGYALYLLEQDQIDMNDAAAVAAALDQLATTRTDLVSTATPPAPSGGPVAAPPSAEPGLTRERIEAMTPRELAQRDPEEIRKALGQQ